MGSVYNDMSGDEVENAKVSLELEGAHVKYSISDDKGYYRIYNIAEGTYDIVVTAMGFAPLKITAVPIKALENTEINLSFHGETFSQDTIVMSYQEAMGQDNTSEKPSQKEKKEKKSKEQKRLERAANKLED